MQKIFAQIHFKLVFLLKNSKTKTQMIFYKLIHQDLKSKNHLMIINQKKYFFMFFI